MRLTGGTVRIYQPMYQGGSGRDEDTGPGEVSFDLARAFAAEKDNPGKLVAGRNAFAEWFE